MVTDSVEVLENNIKFTPFYFYTSFLTRVAKHYSQNQSQTIVLDYVKGAEIDLMFGNYYLDPISLPLIVSLGEQLSRFHKHPIDLRLVNNIGVNDSLNFLNQAEFFAVSGENNIFKFNNLFLGGFKQKLHRSTHKLRGYSLQKDNLYISLETIQEEEKKRDFLIQHYTFRVINEFEELLIGNPNISGSTSDYVEILAELITNGVLHSKSNVYALMFYDKFNVKFSISDNGIGFEESLQSKNEEGYNNFEIFNFLKSKTTLKISESILDTTFSIFEALFYSMLKERRGLFDLMTNVVLEGNGYFRIHNGNSQLIVSKRLIKELEKLYSLREEIIELHNRKEFELIQEPDYSIKRNLVITNAKREFIQFAISLISNYSKDTQFSAIRFFSVKFRGVHIEVEIPNKTKSHDYF